MAIISASRRTDIPTYFGDWFMNRLRAGEVYTRNNPYNPNAVSHITFRKKDIDCIVFWTKNPASMMKHLDELKNYPCYFQYTLTGYEKNLEGNVPDLVTGIQTFREIEHKLNPHLFNQTHRVVWRYDPIVFTDYYTMDWHIRNFNTIAIALAGFCNRVVISFADMYSFVQENMLRGGIVNQAKSEKQLLDFCKQLAEIAYSQGMEIYTCAEKIDLESVGIKHGACIDKAFIESLVGYPLKVGKDKAQREACGCVEAVDFGKYNTCKNGCRYCYACKNPSDIPRLFSMYDADSPILCDTLKPTDIITERRLKSFRTAEELDQLTLF